MTDTATEPKPPGKLGAEKLAPEEQKRRFVEACRDTGASAFSAEVVAGSAIRKRAIPIIWSIFGDPTITENALARTSETLEKRRSASVV